MTDLTVSLSILIRFFLLTEKDYIKATIESQLMLDTVPGSCRLPLKGTENEQKSMLKVLYSYFLQVTRNAELFLLHCQSYKSISSSELAKPRAFESIPNNPGVLAPACAVLLEV